MAANMLTTLPAELQLEILSYLPAKQIVRARQINNHFQLLIDNPAHAGLLLARRHHAAMSRLSADYHELYNINFKEKDLLDYVFMFIHRRGLTTDCFCAAELLIPRIWTRKWAPPKPIHTATRFILHTLKKKKPYSEYEARTFVNLIMRTGCQEYGITAANVRAWYTRIHKFDFSSLPAWYKIQVPKRPLTTLFYNDGLGHTNDPGIVLGYWRQASQEEISELLGVTMLPSFRGLESSWCVKSAWAYELVRNAMDQGIDLQPLEKVAVLEDMYLY